MSQFIRSIEKLIVIKYEYKQLQQLCNYLMTTIKKKKLYSFSLAIVYIL